MEFLRGLQVKKAPLKKPLPSIYPIVKLQKKDISIVPGKYYFPDENRHDYTYSEYGAPNDPRWEEQFNDTKLIMDSFNPINYNVPCYYDNNNNKLSEYIYAGGKNNIQNTEEIFINEIFTIPTPGLLTSTQATRY